MHMNTKKNNSGDLIIARKELALQKKENAKQATELTIADKEHVAQNNEKKKRAAELAIANKKLVFQNKEKEKRAGELAIANKELVLQNKEKEKRAAELAIANKKLAFENKEKEKRAGELAIANKELVFQNKEKEKRAGELAIANKELVFQNKEKEKRAAELVTANEELKQAQAVAHLGNWELNFATGIATWSEEMLKIYGLSPEKNLQTYDTWLAFIHPEDLGYVLKITTQERNTSGNSAFHHRIIRQDGTIRHLYSRANTEFNRNGEPVGLHGAVHDITEMKEAGDILMESERKLTELIDFNQKLIDISPMGIASFDGLSGQCLSVNESFAKIIGASREQTLEQNFRNIKSWKESDLLKDAEETLSDGQIHQNEVKITTSFGNELWIDYKFVTFSDKGQNLLLLLLNDVTQRKQAEQALRESESNIQAIFDNSSDGFVLADTKGIIKAFNRKAKGRIKLNTEQDVKVGTSMFDYIHTSRKGDYKDSMSKILAGEILHYDYAYTRKNGETKWFHFTANPVYERDTVTGISISSADITQRKNNEELLRKSESNFNAIIENTDAIIYSLDKDYNYITFNSGLKKSMKELYGIDVQQGDNVFGGMRQFDVAQADEWEAIYSKAFKGEIIKFEKESKLNELYKCTSFSIHPIWENKNVTGLSCFASDITKQKKDAVEKKKLEDLLDKTNRLAAIGSWEIDVDKGTVFWSDITKEIREVNKDFVPQLDVGISYFNEGRHKEIISQKVKECIENGTPWDEELEIITFKGNPKWVRTIGEGEFVNRKCIRVYGSFQDIDKRKKAELEVLKIYEEKNLILASIGDGFYTLDNNWIITYWNKQAEKMLGKTKEETLGKNFWEVFPEAVDTPSYAAYFKAARENTIQHFERFNIRFKGWFQISIYPSATGLSVYFQDVTERQQAEQQIKADKNFLRTLIDHLPDTIYYKDKAAKKLISNKFDYAVLGADTEQEVLGKTDMEISSHANALITYAQDMEILNTGKSLINFEEYFTTADDKPLWLLTTKLAIRNDNNEIIGLLGIGRDITQRKIAQEKLIELNVTLEKNIKQLEISNTELEQFAYVASHDLQEPLRMITSFLTLLEKRYRDKLDDKGKQYIGFAVDGGKRMRQIILDLLEFSRVGRTEDTWEKVDLNELVYEILSLQSQQIKDVKAKVQMDTLPILNSYKAPLRQVFQNLINNGLKYHRDGVAPHISISVNDDDTFWQFAITDNGIGIENSYLHKIFIIFQRLHNKEKYTGTGIGLAITKKIIENLGGKIWVESEEGTGSTFYFTIKK